MNPTYIEQHYALSVANFEGLWEMTFKHPYNGQENVSIYLKAPNSNPQNTVRDSRPMVEAGPRLMEMLDHLLLKIESYPFTWDYSGKKIIPYGYDFESDYSGTSLSKIDLTEIAFREVIDHYNIFSPLEKGIVAAEDQISGKGVMARLDLILDKPKKVNHLAIDFFAEYPMDLLTVMYKEDQNATSPTYEIPLDKVVQSNNLTYLHFSPVFAKVFYIIIRQESYTLQNGHKTEEEAAKEQLWNQASEKSKLIYESTVKDYMSELFSSVSGIQLHQEVLDSYKNASKAPDVQVESSMNGYRTDFNEAKKQMDSEQR